MHLSQLLNTKVGLSVTSVFLRIEEAISIEISKLCLSPPAPKGLVSFLGKKSHTFHLEHDLKFEVI